VIFGLTMLLLLVAAPVSSASVSDTLAAHASKKKCKKGWVRKRGKCHRRKAFPARPPATAISTVRASLSWNGTASLDLQVEDSTGNRAGYYPGTGSLNEIPSALYGGNVDTGPGTETFTDQAYFPSLGAVQNRRFLFTWCVNWVGGSDPVPATFRVVESSGIVTTWNSNLSPGSGSSCAGYWG
jgi:hypothetical protein